VGVGQSLSPTTTGEQVTGCPVVADPESASCCARRRRYKIGEAGGKSLTRSSRALGGRGAVEARWDVGGAGCWSGKKSPSGFWGEKLRGRVGLRRCDHPREASGLGCLAALEKLNPVHVDLQFIALSIRTPRCTTTQSRALHCTPTQDRCG
jgi:hypothetical protein